jgi:hypothetical protein
MKNGVCGALLCGVLSGWAGVAAGADGGDGGEIARIKAVYLYHFATFAEWPEQASPAPGADLPLCVVGGGEVEAQLRRLDGRKLGDGRALRVVALERGEVPKECRMAFFGQKADFATDPAWLRFRGQPLLSVGDRPGFALAGGMIEMYLRDDKVRMRINLAAVRAAGLRLSSKLLRLAEIVEAP